MDGELVALRALSEIDAGVGGGSSSCYGGSALGPGLAAGPDAASGAAGAGASAPHVVDMSEALSAMEALQLPSEVSDRVCEFMVAAAAEAGAVTGARFLQMVVDEGVKPAIAMKLRQRLGIAAVVPPRTVRHACLCRSKLCLLVRC